MSELTRDISVLNSSLLSSLITFGVQAREMKMPIRYFHIHTVPLCIVLFSPFPSIFLPHFSSSSMDGLPLSFLNTHSFFWPTRANVKWWDVDSFPLPSLPRLSIDSRRKEHRHNNKLSFSVTTLSTHFGLSSIQPVFCSSFLFCVQPLIFHIPFVPFSRSFL